MSEWVPGTIVSVGSWNQCLNHCTVLQCSLSYFNQPAVLEVAFASLTMSLPTIISKYNCNKLCSG